MTIKKIIIKNIQASRERIFEIFKNIFINRYKK